MRFLHDGRNILDKSAAEDDVRDGNDQRLFVDGVEQALGVDVDAVIVRHHLTRAPRARCASQKYITEGKFKSL